jgi:hypothetical protein
MQLTKRATAACLLYYPHCASQGASFKSPVDYSERIGYSTLGHSSRAATVPGILSASVDTWGQYNGALTHHVV